MAQPKPSTAASNTYEAPPSGFETSPTTSPEHSSKQEDSDPNYTPNYEEPANARSEGPKTPPVRPRRPPTLPHRREQDIHTPGHNILPTRMRIRRIRTHPHHLTQTTRTRGRARRRAEHQPPTRDYKRIISHRPRTAHPRQLHRSHSTDRRSLARHHQTHSEQISAYLLAYFQACRYEQQGAR